MALPSIATLFDFELPQTNIIISEEENHSSSLTVFEKTIPRTLNVHDFLKFFEPDHSQLSFDANDDPASLNPLRTIFSPPPEA